MKLVTVKTEVTFKDGTVMGNEPQDIMTELGTTDFIKLLKAKIKEDRNIVSVKHTLRQNSDNAWEVSLKIVSK